MNRKGFVNIKDGLLHYSLHGSGPALVFAHGLGGNERSWFQQIPELSAFFTCIVFSHRGFAPSRDDKIGAPQPHLFSEDLKLLLDHLGLTQIALVAQSMGGWTAMEFALSAPERVKAIILAGTTGTLADPHLSSLQTTGADPVVAALRADGIHPAAGRRMAEEQKELHTLFKEIDHSSGTWDRDAVRRKLDSMRVRSPADLRAINCPTLALVGEEDIVCPPANMAILSERGLAKEVIIVPQAGHSVYFERAHRFNALVKDFLSACAL